LFKSTWLKLKLLIETEYAATLRIWKWWRTQDFWTIIPRLYSKYRTYYSTFKTCPKWHILANLFALLPRPERSATKASISGSWGSAQRQWQWQFSALRGGETTPGRRRVAGQLARNWPTLGQH